MGLPSGGVDCVERNILGSAIGPLILSIFGFSVNEFVLCYQRAAPLADGIELNISCPNDGGLQEFRTPEVFRELLMRINSHRTTPLFVKIPPYEEESPEQENVLSLVGIAREMGVDGITATNTRFVTEPKLSSGHGGLSGKPLLSRTLQIVTDVRKVVGDSMTVNACGGISNARDVICALRNGANTVQMHTALVYEGAELVKEVNRDLGISVL